MHFTKKIKHILLLIFLVINLTSCEKECFEAGDFGSKTVTLIARDESAMGTYSEIDGGQIRSWMDTGLKSNGEPFVINVSGGWSSTNANMNEDSISKVNSCSLCFKKLNGNSVDSFYSSNCGCGPYLKDSTLDQSGKLIWNTPKTEALEVAGTTNSVACSSGNENGDICTCNTIPENEKFNIFSKDWVLFHLKTYSKYDPLFPHLESQKNSTYLNESCAFKMGVGAYISLWGKDGNVTPKKAYHLASLNSFCPITLTDVADTTNKKCSKDGKDFTKVTFRSLNNKIFVKCYGPSDSELTEEEQNGENCKKNIDTNTGHTKPYYHKPGEVIKLTIFDQYYGDNSGKYYVEFLGGIQSATPDGLIASIVKEMDGYLFGSRTYDTGTQSFIVREGVVQFMYKKIINDKVAKNVILISLILYVSFFGLAFFMGLVDFGKKEITMRILKIGLVIAFTSPKSWSFYNTFVVELFKNGMDSLVNVITDIFQSNMQPAVFNSAEGSSGVARKFIYIDDVILTLISKSTISKIFGLLFVSGKELFAIIYIPVIFYLIYFFVSTMLDVALKYLINLFKIAIGLALGPVFILFSLFEKTKDMFNNWLAFVGARSLEIIILFTMLHPFLTIIDLNFKSMLAFRVCSEDRYNALLGTYNVNKSNIDRSLFAWFEYFLKIGSLIFVTKSVCNQAGYISGQLISIGGVSNADASSETGKGEKGFKFASSIVSGMKSLASEAMGSKFGGQRIAHAGRMVLKGLTKLGRTEIGRSGSINDMVNNSFKYFGIRNRGIRSLLRDRQIDSAIATASAKAESQGLTGENRDSFIRNEAMSELTQFANNNKNKAVALGLDNHNIQKRFEQKLVKEPLKNFIAEKAKELKEQGIFGKDARDKIEKAVKDWGKGHENEFRNNKAQELKGKGMAGAELQEKLEMEVQEWAKSHRFERKVSDFMKKKSIQSYIKANAEMSAYEAVENVKNIIKTGDVNKAQNYIKNFRENAIQNRLDIDSEREDRKREGGAIVKVASVGVNLISKILKPVAVPLYFAGANIYNRANKKKIKSLRDANKEYKLAFSKNKISAVLGKKTRKTLGRFDNAVLGLKDHVTGLIRGPFLGDGSLDRNPRKNLRKFDRKLARMLDEKSAKGNGQDRFKELSIKEKLTDGTTKLVNINQEKILGKYFKSDYIKKDDKNTTKVGKGLKIAGAGLAYPVIRPFEILGRRVYQYFNPKNNNEMKQWHKNAKLEVIRSVFDENKNLVDQFVSEKRSEFLKSEIAKKKDEESDQDYKDRLKKELSKKIQEENKYNTKRTEPEERMALALKEIKNSAINDVKKDQNQILQDIKINNDELTNKFNIEKEKRRLTPKEKKELLKKAERDLKIEKGNEELQKIAQKLKNLEDIKEGETVFERLAKIDYMYGTKLIEIFAGVKDNLVLLNTKIESLDKENKLKDFLNNNNMDLTTIFWQFEENQDKLKIREIVINQVNKGKVPSLAHFDDQKELSKNILNYEIDKKIDDIADGELTKATASAASPPPPTGGGAPAGGGTGGADPAGGGGGGAGAGVWGI